MFCPSTSILCLLEPYSKAPDNRTAGLRIVSRAAREPPFPVTLLPAQLQSLILDSCDVPSHAYTFPFAPNADWPRFLATSKDVLAYLDKVTTRLDLNKYIKLNHQVASCVWDDEKGKWRVKVQLVEPKSDWSSQEPLRVLAEFEDEADVLLCATGPLNRWDLPNLEGLEGFKGRVVHTAGWPDDYREEQWKGESVVVLGSGSSAVQTVPNMQVSSLGLLS